MSIKQEKRQRRHKKIRMRVIGSAERPRLRVFRSNQHIYAQLLDDSKAKVLLYVSDRDLKSKKGKKQEIAKEVGKLVAKKAAELKLNRVVFDRSGVLYHGRIKALADGAREGGLQF